MAKSSGVSRSSAIQDLSRATYSDPQSRFTYTVSQERTGLVLSVRRNGLTESTFKRSLPYFVGSGNIARTFLIDVGGFLYESPVTCYEQSHAWNFSPGYEKYSYPFLTRAIAPACLDCHATQILPLPGTQNGYQSPPFIEAGVGCERCHGPGALHVRTGKAIDIVNPAKLSPSARDSVCAQCHLSGEVRVERAGRSQRDFRAGAILSDYSIAFVRDSLSARRRVTSHEESLAQSACQRKSGPTLWCGTCHDPHSSPSPAQKPEWFRARCSSCHATAECKGPAHTRAERKNDCVSCHMPKTAVADAEHAIFTDHSIPRRKMPLEKGRFGTGLVPFGRVEVTTSRDLGIAYAIVALREQSPLFRERAFDLLLKAQTETPDEPQTLSYLADLYRTRGDDLTASKLYERLLIVDPTQSGAPVALGGYAMQRGDYRHAAQLWNQALRISPALVLVRFNLALAFSRLGMREEAMAVLQEALVFNPSFEGALTLLQDLRAGKLP